nr:CHC2 zinc finger domain-containing protein [Clostridium sp. OF09-10]
MNTAEVDLDRLVDYEREYRSVVKKAQVTGDHMIGLCPFHDDSKNSFSVDLKTGRWHCFSEDIGGNYVDFVAKINGISTKDAYKRIMEDYHVEMPEKEKPAAGSRRSYTMEQYSSRKGCR